MSTANATKSSDPSVREAVGVFHTGKTLEDAVADLLSRGFDQAEISVLAEDRVLQDKLHRANETVRELEDDPDAPRRAFVESAVIREAKGGLVGTLLYIGAVAGAGSVALSGGTLLAAAGVAVMAGGGGAAVGSVFAKLLDERHAKRLQGQLEQGGLLLWVRTHDTEHERSAVEILSRHGGEDVHVHEVQTPA